MDGVSAGIRIGVIASYAREDAIAIDRLTHQPAAYSPSTVPIPRRFVTLKPMLVIPQLYGAFRNLAPEVAR